MADKTQTMLRTIINGQSAMKSELLTKIDRSHNGLLTKINEIHKEVQNLKKETKEGFKKVNKRIDTIGMHLENVDEDAPTHDEFDKLEKRVTKVETKLATI